MYSKEELKQIKTTFWSDFKSHMSKHRSVNGRKMNWLNYPSDVSFIHIRVDADGNGARFCFDIQAKDAGIRAIIWEQMHELKVVLEAEMGEAAWIENCSSPAIAQFNRIIWENTELNFFNPEHRTAIFTFLEDRLVHFDAFYQDFKEVVVNLVK
ncbi:MAG: hypothetical protein A3D31_06175 [Candidatus Fluviicola riflensis]|nr:MAG: hypothetical protein CHH17_08840 [Candidatus Fluviicola riflensis]OGS79549.1 MAG: hypothetical protein A3D31_06175 [Candidatus Fluviicola riflensis]OGS86980.1 MAG: hypothetical protein A2724_05635 [Fluviicola sp. RIFCSPHIGHO2_01_FULL_43_53]OGS89771.1 MAG: hypothetical protein A3E30_02380 [Fluviicola sp. RIFCSPHIGHO2_12_FULL_43_24]